MSGTPISMSELVDAFHFVNGSGYDENQAYIHKITGKFFFVSDYIESEDDGDTPQEFDTEDYHAVPNKQDLDLGRQLAVSFVAEESPHSLDTVRDIFRRRGAYSRFKQLLMSAGMLEKWYAFEERAIEAALRSWCEEVGITPVEAEKRP